MLSARWSRKGRRAAGTDRARRVVEATPVGELQLTRGGRHHRERVVHAGGDATGAECSARSSPRSTRRRDLGPRAHTGPRPRSRPRTASPEWRARARRRRADDLAPALPRLSCLPAAALAGPLLDDRPGRLDRGRRGPRAAGRRPDPGHGVRSFQPDRALGSGRTRAVSSRLVGGRARRGRPSFVDDAASASCRASTSSPTLPRATSCQGDHAADARRQARPHMWLDGRGPGGAPVAPSASRP